MAAGEVLYRLEGLQHCYGERAVLDIDRLDVVKGETLAIIGPSGAGKSTLLRLLQFLEAPTAGRVAFEGQPVDGPPPLRIRRRITTVFQHPRVLSRSVYDNVAFGLRVRGIRPDRDQIDRLLGAVGISALARRPARVLSGGEVQRLAICRALAFEPDVLLLDEPTANLDPRNVRLVEALIHERQARGVTIVAAVHQVFQARRLADRIALLLDGQIVEVGPADRVLDAPQDPRTRAFLSGDMIY
jgi:tungstate transport system ATP-binding protein